MTTRIIVMAKVPEPGRSKTRLCPPLTHEMAAAVAEASLMDTMDAVTEAATVPPVLALDGAPRPWPVEGFELITQRGRGLAERLAAAFEDVGGPALLIGMDTPQITPGLLRAATLMLEADDCDAVFGPAIDGGWWALGLRNPDPRVFVGIPMSSAFTGAMQRLRLADLGLRFRTLPFLLDVDRIEDAQAVAAETPGSRFAAQLGRCLGEAAVARAR